MPKRHVLMWFDVEDCTVPQSDDCALRIAEILTENGARGTMKIVGQKLRVMRERVRYRVIEELGKHAVGYHSDMHGQHPQPAEYMAPCDWLDGQEEFARRERRGVDDLIETFGRVPCTYGQPGGNWSPQVFPVLRRWGIPSYVSGFGYVGLDSQPFYYGGIPNMSHLYGIGGDREPNNYFGLGFELGTDGALEDYMQRFDAIYDRLPDGGTISIANHPVQFAAERWWCTDLKPREQRERGYEQFEGLVKYIGEHPDAEFITAEDLPRIYPDRAAGRVFSAEELHELAVNVGTEVYFQRFDGMALSAAELFGMFTRFLGQSVREGRTAPGAVCEHLDGPADDTGLLLEGWLSLDREDFAESVLDVEDFIRWHGRMPDDVLTEEGETQTPDWFCCAAQMVVSLIESGELPDGVETGPAQMRVEEHVDTAAAEGSWRGSMAEGGGFDGSNLLQQARLQAWTLKPAILAE